MLIFKIISMVFLCLEVFHIVRNDWDVLRKFSLDITPFSSNTQKSSDQNWMKSSHLAIQFSLKFSQNYSWLHSTVVLAFKHLDLLIEYGQVSMDKGLPKFSQLIAEHCSQDNKAFVFKKKKRISMAHAFSAEFLEKGAWTASKIAVSQNVLLTSKVIKAWKYEYVKITLWADTQHQGKSAPKPFCLCYEWCGQDNVSHRPLQSIFKVCIHLSSPAYSVLQIWYFSCQQRMPWLCFPG